MKLFPSTHHQALAPVPTFNGSTLVITFFARNFIRPSYFPRTSPSSIVLTIVASVTSTLWSRTSPSPPPDTSIRWYNGVCQEPGFLGCFNVNYTQFARRTSAGLSTEITSLFSSRRNSQQNLQASASALLPKLRRTNLHQGRRWITISLFTYYPSPYVPIHLQRYAHITWPLCLLRFWIQSGSAGVQGTRTVLAE